MLECCLAIETSQTNQIGSGRVCISLRQRRIEFDRRSAARTTFPATFGKTMATGPKDEQILDLPDGRKLAFTVTGDSSAATGNTLLLAFHGALGVGDFSSFEHVFRDSNYFCVAPTLPGWSNSSPTESDVWVTAYWKDILALVHHLEAKLSRKFETLDCMGVSYGSLAALHTAANLQRNGGPKVGKCLSMSGFVPFRTPGLDYSEGMTFQTKLTMGTFARWNPWFARFTASMVGRYTATIESTTKFAQDNIAGQLNADEKAQMERIRKQDPQDARLDPNVMGRNMYFSLRVSKKGYSTIPQNLWWVWAQAGRLLLAATRCIT